MIKRYNDMSASQRRMNRVESAQVLSTGSGTVTVLTVLPNQKKKIETLYCSFADELSAGEDYIDITRYLTGEKTSTKVLGLTPDEYR